MSKAKFKVGDKVQLTPKLQKQYNSIGDKRGEVIRTGSTGNRSMYCVSFEGKKMDSWYYSYELDLVPKFKKGDKVSFAPQAKQWLIDNEYWGLNHKSYRVLINPDEQYTISEVYKSDGHDGYKGYKYNLVGVDCIVATDDDLELVTEVTENKVDTNSKFKVGDEVILTEKAKKWLIEGGYKNLNKTYTILEITNFHGHSYILKEITNAIVFFDDDLELYDENKDNQRTDRMKKWVDICNEYLKEFCDRHDCEYHPLDWVGGEVGTIIEIADMFVTMDNIRYDVDNDIPTDKFFDWYWNSVEHSELGLNYMNYPSYCKGAPDPYTQEQIQSIREGQIKVRQTKEDLRKMIDDLGGDFSKLLF